MRILGWLFMLACGAAVGLLFGVAPHIAFYIAFAVLAVNFATFCLMYDEPFKRARNRTEQQLLQISSKGVHAEEYQRLQSRKVVATAEDHRFQLTLTSGLNLISGIAGVGMMCWGAIARIAE
jgi:hypothetical protein